MYICCGIPFFIFIFIYDELRKVGTALSAVQHMAAARTYVPASHGADVVLAGWHWFCKLVEDCGSQLLVLVLPCVSCLIVCRCASAGNLEAGWSGTRTGNSCQLEAALIQANLACWHACLRVVPSGDETSASETLGSRPLQCPRHSELRTPLRPVLLQALVVHSVPFHVMLFRARVVASCA
jgi:hypothetical protein